MQKSQLPAELRGGARRRQEEAGARAPSGPRGGKLEEAMHGAQDSETRMGRFIGSIRMQIIAAAEMGGRPTDLISNR